MNEVIVVHIQARGDSFYEVYDEHGTFIHDDADFVTVMACAVQFAKEHNVEYVKFRVETENHHLTSGG
jgi:hypothetical protein